MSVENVMKIIKDNDAKFVSMRFTDTRGMVQHLGWPVSNFFRKIV